MMKERDRYRYHREGVVLDFVALRYALEQDLFLKGFKLRENREQAEKVLDRFFGSLPYRKYHRKKRAHLYLGSADIGEVPGERAAHFWQMHEEEKPKEIPARLFALKTIPYQEEIGQEVNPERDILKLVVGPDDSIISETIDNPLIKIAVREMTLQELLDSGEYELPVPAMRHLDKLKVTEPYEFEPWSWLDYRAAVLLPLLGIKLIPESDIEYVQTVVLDEVAGTVKFEYNREYWRSRKDDIILRLKDEIQRVIEDLEPTKGSIFQTRAYDSLVASSEISIIGSELLQKFFEIYSAIRSLNVDLKREGARVEQIQHSDLSDESKQEFINELHRRNRLKEHTLKERLQSFIREELESK
ncbi:MAG: hypothetical protein ACFFBM_06935 [Promethearchaeota archaeon]